MRLKNFGGKMARRKATNILESRLLDRMLKDAKRIILLRKKKQREDKDDDDLDDDDEDEEDD
jgi:hypothetical protein